MQIDVVFLGLSGGCFLLVVLASAAAIRGLKMFKPLGRLPEETGHRVSIIVAAKDEADTLRESLASLVGLNHVDKEIIVVCGPSVDGTENVAHEFADRVIVLREPERPSDWLGKSWACHNGYLRSNGDVLLFADGDVLHSKESLGVALSNLDSKGADLLSLWPEIVTRTTSERVILPASLFFLCVGVGLVATRPTPRGRRIDGANGQYILVKRAAYTAMGGHAAIKGEIMEDGALGRRALGRGLEAINADGEGCIKVKPYSRFGETWEAHERFGAGLVPSWGALGAACLLALGFYVAPFAILAGALLTANLALSLAAALVCALVLATESLFSRRVSRAWHCLLAPLSGVLVAAAFTSGFVRFRRGGILWKRVRYAKGLFKALAAKASTSASASFARATDN